MSPSKDFRLYTRLLQRAMPYWRIALLSIIAMVALGALEPLLPALLKPLIDQSLIAKNPDALWTVPLQLVAVFALKGIADYFANVSSQRLALNVVSDLRSAIFEHQLRLPMARHYSEDSGRMVSRITYDTAAVSEAVSQSWLTLIRDSLVLLALAIFMLWTSWQLTLMVAVIAPIAGFVVTKTSRSLRLRNHRVQDSFGRVNGLLQQALAGIKEIKVFGAQGSETERFLAVSHTLRDEQIRVAQVQALNVPLVQLIAAIAVSVVIYFASKLTSTDSLSPGGFVAFVTAMSMTFEPVRRLTNVNATLQRGLAAADSIFKFLDEPEEISVNRGLTQAVRNTRSLGPAIIFEAVSVTYPNRDRPALDRLSFKIQAGEVVALTGPSGGGKSTVVNLLAGFLRPSEGDLRLFGRSVEEMAIQDQRALLSYVGQDPMLFSRTIAENLRMAKPGASTQEIWEALRMARVDNFVRELPDQLDADLGYRSQAFSGGQLQRLAIARALLKGAPLLILDEPTSALDVKVERDFLMSIQSLAGRLTVLMVTHSIDNLPDGFRIMTIQDGRLV